MNMERAIYEQNVEIEKTTDVPWVIDVKKRFELFYMWSYNTDMLTRFIIHAILDLSL